MNDYQWIAEQAEISLERLLPGVETIVGKGAAAEVFIARLREHFPTIFQLLYELYGDQYDFFYHLEAILSNAAQMYMCRPKDLKTLDQQREANPLWYKSERMMGGVCYVDLFAGNLEGIRAKIPYFKELGLTYLHLMPLFKAPEEDSDGGYAVSDYRAVNPALGTMEQLAALSGELRENGISLVLDFVFNHTSKEHTWAQKALEGEAEYQQYYYMFDDRVLPDQYERNLREIFPEQAPENFTYEARVGKWVWTTFRRFQWDLNYRNPAVFNAMLGELLFLANQGVEVLRLDAVAFIWKQMGTGCENLPQAHSIIRAYNALMRVVAPSMLFKSEAIVHPDDVASYVSWEESPLSYNPTLMALLWEALATRDVKLLRHSMMKRFGLPPECAWVNYVRVHDDIGWTFADEDAAELWINGYDHRQFLNRFYTGRFEGSFAKGLPFNYNPVNQDMRICGTAASLAGLEQAIEIDDPMLVNHAIARLLLIHSVIISAGGIPLLYLGDEIGTLNDYRYQLESGKKDDSRWVHRSHFDWGWSEKRNNIVTIPGQIFQGLVKLIHIRQHNATFAGANTQFFDSGNTHVLAYSINGQILALGNFSERPQAVQWETAAPYIHSGDVVRDLVSGNMFQASEEVILRPYQFMWLANT